MRLTLAHLPALWIALLVGSPSAFSQPPAKAPKPVPVPDELEEIAKEIKKAQEPIATRENDILKEIRKAYFAQSPAQEEKIIKEIRRAYLPTPAETEAILQEIRNSYGAPTAAKEEKIIQEIQKAQAIPLGWPWPDSMASRAESLFRKLDQNGDGLLNFDEMPATLREERGKRDSNRDGFIDVNEYKAYFQDRTYKVVEESIGRPAGSSGGARPVLPAGDEEDRKPVVYRAGNLPKDLPLWFRESDGDGDGQVSLYEWRITGRAIADFQRMDRNGDGFLTIGEVMYDVSGRNQLNGVPIAPPSTAREVPETRPFGTTSRGSGGPLR